MGRIYSNDNSLHGKGVIICKINNTTHTFIHVSSSFINKVSLFVTLEKKFKVKIEREINFEKLDGASNYHVWREAVWNAMILKDYDDPMTMTNGAIVEKDAKKLKKAKAYLML